MELFLVVYYPDGYFALFFWDEYVERVAVLVFFVVEVNFSDSAVQS